MTYWQSTEEVSAEDFSTKPTENVYIECYWSGLRVLPPQQSEYCKFAYLKDLSEAGCSGLGSPRGIRNLSHYFGVLTALFTVREKLKCWRRQYIPCQIWSSPSEVCLRGKTTPKWAQYEFISCSHLWSGSQHVSTQSPSWM